MKEIYSHINDGRSVFSKPKRTDRAKGLSYYCECPEKCNLYSQGKCLLRNIPSFCKYGRINSVLSPTVIGSSFFSPGYIPKRFCANGNYPTVEEVFRYVNRNDAQLDLFEPEEGYSCMSIYHGLCE